MLGQVRRHPAELDLAERRWDTSEHCAEDVRRMCNGNAYPPFHDLMMMVDGDAARLLAVVGSLRDRTLLRQLLGDRHAAVQAAASTCLTRVGDYALVEHVLDTLHTRPPIVRVFQLRILRDLATAVWWVQEGRVERRVVEDVLTPDRLAGVIGLSTGSG